MSFDSVFCADSEYDISIAYRIDFEIDNWKIRAEFWILPLKLDFFSNTVQFKKSRAILLIYGVGLVEWQKIQSSTS